MFESEAPLTWPWSIVDNVWSLYSRKILTEIQANNTPINISEKNLQTCKIMLRDVLLKFP